MSNNATNFIQKRKKDKVALTNTRLKHIIWYVIECYQIILKVDPKYSKEWVKNNTKIAFEDYLKFRLLKDYLIKNKKILESVCSELETINFLPEPQTEYFDHSINKEAIDKIDIFINMLGLQESWNEQEENIYFAIECKRIEILSDCKAYIEDIQKFADRNHKDLRLPFEGQLAFIESIKLTHALVSAEINKRLKTYTSIKTIKDLKAEKIHASFKGCYTSIHKRNFGKKGNFKIFHLLFDYSGLVVN